MKKNLGYIRVSTKEQANLGHSLKQQKESIKNYAKAINIKSVEVIADEGYSAKSIKRPSYLKLISMVKNNEVDNIIFYKIDRISRNILDFNDLIQICIENNVNLISISDNINFNSAVGRFLANIIISLAQMEREQTSERTIAGIEGGLLKGKYSFGGSLPLGISKDNDGKIYYNKEIKIVKEMFEMDEQGYSYSIIKNKINEKYGYIFKSKNTVESLLKNEIYRGYRTYNGKKYKFLEPIVKDKEDKDTNIRKRKLSKHNYMFIKYLKDDFTVSTTKKKLSNGRIKEYKYYIHKTNKDLKISEEELLDMVSNKTKLDKIKWYKKKQESENKVNNLYIMSDINKKQRREYIKYINGNIKKLYLKSKVIDINICEKGICRLKLENGKEYKELLA